jgi:hypothetical protein
MQQQEGLSMNDLGQYSNRYRNISFERRESILQITLHTNGGPLKWGAIKGSIHDQLGDAFYHVGARYAE